MVALSLSLYLARCVNTSPSPPHVATSEHSNPFEINTIFAIPKLDMCYIGEAVSVQAVVVTGCGGCELREPLSCSVWRQHFAPSPSPTYDAYIYIKTIHTHTQYIMIMLNRAVKNWAQVLSHKIRIYSDRFDPSRFLSICLYREVLPCMPVPLIYSYRCERHHNSGPWTNPCITPSNII